MAFEWHRMHKWEENIESEVTDAVEQQVTEQYGVDSVVDLTEEQICEHYSVDDVLELTAEQMDEVRAFRDEHVSEYSPMNWGFSNVIMRYEDENYEEEEEE